ncbi:MAG TPA: MFS transporter [Chloroflexota bacterium]|nr:MFS transporter [Chloroflexota bacterium]
MTAPLAFPAFRWLWCSTLAAAGAQWMERVATAWLALEAGAGSPFAVGIVFAARMLPSLLFGLAAGTIADRAERRRQLLAVGGTAAALMLALGLLVRLGAVAFWHVVAISFLAGCVQVFDAPARQALLLDAVGREIGANAVALNAFAMRLLGAVGAFAGGLLIPLLGVANCYLAVAVIYLVGVALLAAIKLPKRTEHARVVHPPFRRALADAIRLVVAMPAVRTLSIAGIACEVFAFSYMSAVPVFAVDVLDAGPEGLGAMNAAAAIGGTLAVVVLSALPSRVRREPILAASYLTYGAAILTLAGARSLPLAVAILVVVGACAAAFDALEQTLIQMAVPEEQRGRAVGIWVLGLGSAPLGHLEMGALASSLGAPSALLINGALVVAGALTLFARAPAYRFAALSLSGRGPA